MTGQESATSRPVADETASARGQGYTEQDVRWLAEQIETVEVAVQYDGYPSARSCSKQEIAEQALAALAAAGRLLPEDTRTEWAWECGEAGPGHKHVGEEDWVRNIAPKYWPGGRAVSRAAWVGPWVPVPEPEPPLCAHCGKPAAGGVTFMGGTPLCSEPCYDLVDQGHPATATRPGRGPCPDCAYADVLAGLPAVPEPEPQTPEYVEPRLAAYQRRLDDDLREVTGAPPVGLPAVPEEKRPAAMWVCGASPSMPCTSKNRHRSGARCGWRPVSMLRESDFDIEPEPEVGGHDDRP